MRDTEYDYRTDTRRHWGWIGPLIVLAIIIGVGWWVYDRTRMQQSVLDTVPPVIAPADRGLPQAGVADAGLTGTATGRIDKFDADRRTVTLENGDAFVVAANVAGADALTPGQHVTLTFKIDRDQKVVQSIAVVAPAPDAGGGAGLEVAPAPIAPVMPSRL